MERMLPLYQGIMCGPYDHRVSDVVHSPTALKRQNQPSYLSSEEKQKADRFVIPAYWVNATAINLRLEGRNRSWLSGFRDVTSATNERTLLGGDIPKAGVGHKVPLYFAQTEQSLLTAMLDSFLLDYCARQKIGGTSMTYFIVKQLPTIKPSQFDEAAPWQPHLTIVDWLRPRILELTYTAWDMAPFAEDLDDIDPITGRVNPPFIWDDDRRALLRAEIDAAFFHLYGITRDDVDYILDTFPIVRKHDEADHGEYRTKRLILQSYDAMAAASSGHRYTSPVTPPPGHGPRHAR